MLKIESIYSKDGKKLVIADEFPQISTWGIYNHTILEAPLYIGKSQIETELIGAFTNINQHAIRSEATNCVIECQRIGRFCMFAHSVNIGFPSHPADFLSGHSVFRYDKKSEYAHDFMMLKEDQFEGEMREKYIEHSKRPLPIIGNDVWVGFGATILNGVKIGDGAIIGARAVVTKDVEPYSIVAGNPAKVVKLRFKESIIEKLLKLQWWEYGPDIMHDIDLSNVEKGLDELSNRIESRSYSKYKPTQVVIDNSSKLVRIIDDGN